VLFDFLLWPMLIPMIIPLLYGIKYKRESLLEIIIITLIMIGIVIAYWPLTVGFTSSANIISETWISFSSINVICYILG
jgi:hypothetical protein